LVFFYKPTSEGLPSGRARSAAFPLIRLNASGSLLRYSDIHWRQVVRGSRKMRTFAPAIAVAAAASIVTPVGAQETRNEFRRMNRAENLPGHIRTYHNKPAA
jgi:hypothetical protein